MHSKLDAILYLPFVPESISWRPFRSPVGSQTLLEWFIDQFKEANPQLALRILFHAEDASPFLDEVSRRAQVSLIRTPYKTQLQAFLQAARQTDKPELAFFTLEMGFAPTDLLARTFAHHARHKNPFTSAAGLPPDCAPEIYDAGLLKLIGDIPLPNVPPRLRTLVEQLIFSSQKLSPEISLTPDQTFLRLARTIGEAFADKLNCVPFDASAFYGADPMKLPESLRIRNSAHLDIAKTVIASASRTAEPLAALRVWKATAIEKQRASQRDLIAATGSIARDWRHPLKQHVLFVSTPSAYSGAEESLCQLIGGLDRDLYQPYALIGATGYYTERLRQFGAQVITPNRDFSPNTVENLFFVLSILKQVQADVIHINAPSGMPVILAAKLLNIPIVYHLRGAFLDDITEHLRSVDAIIAVSDFIRGEVERKDIDKAKINVIFDGVDSRHFSRNRFDKAVMRSELGLPPDARIALSIARFSPQKRQDLLIAASALVSKAVPNYHLVLVGEAENQKYYTEIKKQLSNAGLADHTTFLPFQRDIRKIEAAADVLVLCSDREALGTCLIEAMAMELPVVVSDSGGSHELFIDGVTGLVIKGGNLTSLTSAIETALTDLELAQSLSRSARDYATTELSVDRHAKQVMSVYAEVIQVHQKGLEISG